MRRLIPLFLCAIALAAPLRAGAYELKMAADISIGENYISDENLYVAGLKTWFNATHENDVVSAAWDQVIKGTIFGDATLIGNEVDLEGEVFDDVRIVANVVHISGVTNRDLVIVANAVEFEPGAIVNGDSLILANTVSANGQFLGDVQITANVIDVGGSLIGPATLTTQNLAFMPGAKVISDVSYFSPQRAEIAAGAEIQKPLNFNQIESIKQNDVVKRMFFAFVSFWSIIKLVATLFVIFVMTQLFRVFAQRIADIVIEKKWMLLATGTLSAVAIPLVVVLLFASLVLIPVSFIVALIFAILIIILPAMTAISIGSLYKTYVLKKGKNSVDFSVSALVLIALTFIGFVPYVGSAIVYLSYVATFGAMVQYLYEQVRRKKVRL